MIDLLKHRYFCEALALPFPTIFLEIFPLTGSKTTFFDTDSDYAIEEEQFHEVASHLLKTYTGHQVTFILQNWEGDWVFRHHMLPSPAPGSTGVHRRDQRTGKHPQQKRGRRGGSLGPRDGSCEGR